MAPSFRTTLVTGHVLMLLLIAGTAAVSVAALELTNERSETTRAVTDELVAVERLRFQAEQVVATNRGYLLTLNPASLGRFESAVTELVDAIHTVRSRLDPGGASLAFEVESAASAYIDAAIAARKNASSNTPTQALHAYYDEVLRPRRDHFDAKLAALVSYERERLGLVSVEARAFVRRAGLVLLVATLVALSMGIALAFLAIRRLSRTYTKLLAAEREAHAAVEAREEVLAVVSHDLRSPLNAISLATSLLEDDAPARGRVHLRVVQNASERMLHLVNQLLEVHSLDTGHLALEVRRCGVLPLFEEVAQLFQARALASGIELRVEGCEDCVDGDRERLIEILSNLVSNALDHTPEGGAITLRTDRADGELRLVVADTGTGIPADQLPCVFQRNWRSPNRHRKSGFGLGLYICKRLVEAHAGTIGVESVLGAGSSFWFALPRKPSTALFA